MLVGRLGVLKVIASMSMESGHSGYSVISLLYDVFIGCLVSLYINAWL